jgi:nicotinamide-nucleotide amidase
VIVEVIAVGTELLLGQTVNSNAAFIGRRLADEGFDAHFQDTVGDNLARLAETINIAAARSDAVILTGGIGPTPDDLTREALCEFTGRRMLRNEEYAGVIRRRIESLNRAVPENVLRMADYPEGAEQVPNAAGVALGIALHHDGTWFYALPGVPAEMTVMIDEQILPRLRRAEGRPAVLQSRVLRTWGLGESQVSEALDDLYDSTNPSVAFLIDGPEVRIRITAKAEDRPAAEHLIDPIESEVRRRLGAAVFASDGQTTQEILLGLLDQRGWTLAVAETLTAGLVASRLKSVTEARAYLGSLVVDDAQLMDRLLEVDLPPVDDAPATSAAAVALATAVASLFGADVGTAALPAGPADAERGSQAVAIGVSTPEKSQTRIIRLLGNPERVRTFTTQGVMHMTRLGVSGAWWDP